MHPKQEIISSIYSSIRHSDDVEIMDQINLNNNPAPANTIYSIKFVPNYFKTDFSNRETFRIKRYKSVNGYAICLDDYSNVDAYLRNTFQNKGKPIKRALTRLQNCFEITYKMYHGEIDRENYNFIFGLLKKMIEKRFRQRNEKSHNLAHWDSLFKTGHNLINEKKASLFVIYNGDNPIEISFNYHYNKILFSYLSSYDIDYYKFSLGQIEIYKQLEWCFQNEYSYFEMGWGDLDYKRRWSNTIYTFEHHLIFQKKSILAFLFAVLEGNKTKLIAYLLAKKVNVHYKKIKGLFKRKETAHQDVPKVKLEKIEDGNIVDGESPIAFPDVSISFLNAPFNSFLYATQEYYTNVQLYNPIENEYIIQGEEHYQKVILIP